MKSARGSPILSKVILKCLEQGHVRTIVLSSGFLIAGFAAGSLWSGYTPAPPSDPETGQQTEREPLVVLSDATRAALAELDQPVEIRFFSILDGPSASESLRAFSGRLDELLTRYEREGGGRIAVIRHATSPGSDREAAAVAGVRVFNIEKGDSCFLGLTVTCNGEEEVIPRLFPEWEPALEPDLTRAIIRVVEAQRPKRRTGMISQAEADALEEVKRIFPDMDSASLAEGTLILQERTLDDFKAAANEREIRVTEARKRLAEAQKTGSPAEIETARRDLQQIEREQADALKQIASSLQKRISALEELKR